MGHMDENPIEQSTSEPIETPWIDAPSTSHLQSFRFVGRGSVRVPGPSELWVVFRARPKRDGTTSPAATYVYTSYDHLALQQIFDKMSVDSSPGTVLHANLIGQGNVGTRM